MISKRTLNIWRRHTLQTKAVLKVTVAKDIRCYSASDVLTLHNRIDRLTHELLDMKLLAGRN